MLYAGGDGEDFKRRQRSREVQVNDASQEARRKRAAVYDEIGRVPRSRVGQVGGEVTRIGDVHKYRQTSSGFSWVWTRDDGAGGPLAIDAQGNVNSVNHNKIAKYRPSTGWPRWIKNNGDVNPASMLSRSPIATDPDGNVYIGDFSGDFFSHGKRLKINADGTGHDIDLVDDELLTQQFSLAFDPDSGDVAGYFSAANRLFSRTYGDGLRHAPLGTWQTLNPWTAGIRAFERTHDQFFLLMEAATVVAQGYSDAIVRDIIAADWGTAIGSLYSAAVFRLPTLDAYDALVTLPTYFGYSATAQSLCPTSDGGFVVVYNPSPPAAATLFYSGHPVQSPLPASWNGVQRYDSDFALLWDAPYFGTQVQVDADDNVYVLAAGGGSLTGGLQYFVKLAGGDGSYIKHKTIPSPGFFASFRVNPAGDVFVSGARQPKY